LNYEEQGAYFSRLIQALRYNPAHMKHLFLACLAASWMACAVAAGVGASVAVVPLTIPLLTGPATISTMVIYADKTRHWWQLAVLVGYGVVIGLAVWAAFKLSGRIARVLGQTGINVMTRLMGLILAALAVEVMSDGLVKLFPVLASTLR